MNFTFCSVLASSSTSDMTCDCTGDGNAVDTLVRLWGEYYFTYMKLQIDLICYSYYSYGVIIKIVNSIWCLLLSPERVVRLEMLSVFLTQVLNLNGDSRSYALTQCSHAVHVYRLELSTKSQKKPNSDIKISKKVVPAAIMNSL